MKVGDPLPPVQFPPDTTPLTIWNEVHNHMDDTVAGGNICNTSLLGGRKKTHCIFLKHAAIFEKLSDQAPENLKKCEDV